MWILLIRRLRKALAGITAAAKLSLPTRDYRSFCVSLVFCRCCIRSSLYVSSLSAGSCASLLTESSRIPRKVMVVSGVVVFSGARGTPKSLHIIWKVVRCC